MFSCELCKIFNNTSFTEHFRATNYVYWQESSLQLTNFSPNVPFLYSLKTPENHSFSDIFRGYRNGTLRTHCVKEKGHSFPKLGILDLVKHLDVKNMKCLVLNPFRSNSERREKIKAFKAFIKPFEAPQRSMKIKI